MMIVKRSIFLYTAKLHVSFVQDLSLTEKSKSKPHIENLIDAY